MHLRGNLRWVPLMIIVTFCFVVTGIEGIQRECGRKTLRDNNRRVDFNVQYFIVFVCTVLLLKRDLKNNTV